MDRRKFLGYSAVGSASLLSGQMVSAETQEKCPTRSQFVDEGFALHEATITELQQGMASGMLTARSITELYLRRIGVLNRQGPELHAIIETNPEALTIADRLDAERRVSGARGPLHGIPVAIKDNIDTHDQMTTTAGSLALEGSIPPRDSYVAQKLREAGAIILAKANMSEWAYWRGFKASSGWSARGGQCRNPYALNRTPCGSSSGSGVAASANLVALAIGTETGGSIMCPASINGVVGIKPSVGLWSRSGIIPISHSQDTAGPMARTLSDAAALLGAITGVDPRDEATFASDSNYHSDYTQFLDPNGLRGARIGVARNFPGFDKRVLAAFDRAVEDMKAAGVEVIDPANIPSLDNTNAFSAMQMRMLNVEFKANINKYFESLGPNAPIRSLSELITFNKKNRNLEMPFFGQELLLASQQAGSLTDPEYLEDVRTLQHQARNEGIDAVINAHRLDAIVAPTRDPAWVIDHIMGDNLSGGTSAGLAAIAGYPDISIPMGFVSGLPIGVSFFGVRWSEPTLLKVAYGYEQATNHRQAPGFMATLG